MSALSDAQFTLLTAESLLINRTPALTGFEIPGLDPSALPARWRLPLPPGFYQLVRVRGRVLYAYPHGSSLLSVPFVAALQVLGVPLVRAGKTYDEVTETLAAKLLASILMAVTAGLFFEIGIRTRLPVQASLILATGGALGSPIWSSASRTLWSQSWEVLLASYAVLLLPQADETKVHSWRLASSLAWMFFVRPTGAVSIVGVSVYLWLCHRHTFVSYASVLMAWILIFVIYWLAAFGQFLPDYYRQGSSLNLARAAAILPAILVSPSRGLVVFVPTILAVVYLLVRYWNLIDRPIALLATGIICGNLLIVASYPVWWGGWSYGPRLLTGTIPWFVLLGALGCRAMLAGGRPPRLLLWSAFALLFLAVAINGLGAVSWRTALWNRQAAINLHPGACWDWRHPQFLAGLLPD